MTDAVVFADNQTSFLPNFDNKTTSVAGECAYNQPHYLIKISMLYDAGSMMFCRHKPIQTSNELKIDNGKLKMIEFHTSNEVMRSLGVCCLRATEVVLLSKLGGNEVFSDADGWTTTMAVEHRTCRDARTPCVSTWTSGTLGSQSPKDFNLDNPLQAEAQLGDAKAKSKEIEENRKKIEENRKKVEENRKKIEENRRKSKKIEETRKKSKENQGLEVLHFQFSIRNRNK